RDTVEIVEKDEERARIDLRELERHLLEVRVAVSPRKLVSKPGELADAIGDEAADLLRCLPGGLDLVRAPRVAEDLSKPVVGDAFAAELGAEAGELAFDVGLERNDRGDEILVHAVAGEL